MSCTKLNGYYISVLSGIESTIINGHNMMIYYFGKKRPRGLFSHGDLAILIPINLKKL